MRTRNLSQEGQWALRERARCAPRYEPPRRGLKYEPLVVTAIALLIAVAAAVLIGSCSKSLEPQVSSPVWKCLSAPHISIAFDSYDSQGYSYFRLVSRSETTECRALAIDLITMLKDGKWKQIEIGDPLLLPPPPHWDTGISDRLDMGVRINGSTAIRMRTQTPLPTDNQITVEKGQTK